MEDLDPLDYLLGVRAITISDYFILSHPKYVTNILGRIQMQDNKPMATPMLPKVKSH